MTEGLDHPREADVRKGTHAGRRPPLVSVIVAAYGMPDYLNQAVRSVCEQTFRDYELIVVDDCSGEDVVSRYEFPGSATLIRHQTRFGAAAATRNTGIRAAAGRYAAFLDQDDVWLARKLAIQMEAMERAGGDALVFCHTSAVDPSLSPVAGQGRIRRRIRNPLRKLLGGCFIPTPSTVLAPLEAVRECGMFDETIRGASDWDFYLRMARRSPFVPVADRLVLYRMHPEQLHRKIPFMNTAKIAVMEKTLEWVRRERPELAYRARSRYARVLYKVACHQLEVDGDPASALDTLRSARSLWLWNGRALLLSARAAWRVRRV